MITPISCLGPNRGRVALLLVIPDWLTLWIAIFADMGATLIVTANSLRLLKVKE